MKLVVAEKPSVAISIAKALGGIKDKFVLQFNNKKRKK